MDFTQLLTIDFKNTVLWRVIFTFAVCCFRLLASFDWMLRITDWYQLSFNVIYKQMLINKNMHHSCRRHWRGMLTATATITKKMLRVMFENNINAQGCAYLEKYAGFWRCSIHDGTLKLSSLLAGLTKSFQPSVCLINPICLSLSKETFLALTHSRYFRSPWAPCARTIF